MLAITVIAALFGSTAPNGWVSLVLFGISAAALTRYILIDRSSEEETGA